MNLEEEEKKQSAIIERLKDPDNLAIAVAGLMESIERIEASLGSKVSASFVGKAISGERHTTD